MECRFCGAIVDPRRVELGYDYCTADECQRRGLERLRLVRVAVNKAADQFVRADDAMPPGAMPQNRIEDEPHVAPASRPGPRSRPRRQTRSTLRRLQDAEAALDRELDESFQRFSRSEITAEEMAKERDGLIRAFNRMVMAENIRYRGMLRRRRPA